jgi:hypothetical protein
VYGDSFTFFFTLNKAASEAVKSVEVKKRWASVQTIDNTGKQWTYDRSL